MYHWEKKERSDENFGSEKAYMHNRKNDKHKTSGVSEKTNYGFIPMIPMLGCVWLCRSIFRHSSVSYLAASKQIFSDG